MAARHTAATWLIAGEAGYRAIGVLGARWDAARRARHCTSIETCEVVRATNIRRIRGFLGPPRQWQRVYARHSPHAAGRRRSSKHGWALVCRRMMPEGVSSIPRVSTRFRARGWMAMLASITVSTTRLPCDRQQAAPMTDPFTEITPEFQRRWDAALLAARIWREPQAGSCPSRWTFRNCGETSWR